MDRLGRLASLLGLLAVGCAPPPLAQIAGPGPPHRGIAFGPPLALVETPLPRPDPRAVWAGGHWDFRADTGRYLWRPGRWTRPPTGREVYFPPRWVRGPSGWYRLSGRWLPGRARDAEGRAAWIDSAGRPHPYL